jgi:long-chain fatty acid transport protein
MLFSPRLKNYLLAVFTASAVIFSAQTFAGAFQLWEQDAEGIGDYHAGAAAEGNSAASVFYNAASATRLKHQQVSVGGALIALTTSFTGTAYPLNSPVSVTDAPGDTTNIVPNLAYALPFANRWAFAFSVTTPFGLATKYPDVDFVNTLATKTQLQTINLNPSIAYQINHYLSLGVGFDALYGSAIYNADVFGTITDDLTGWGYGYNAGLLAQITKDTRVGLSYRSGITIDAKGPSQSGALHTTASVDFPLPPTTILSVNQDINPRLTLMASAFYTQWSVFRQLIINNISTSFGTGTINLWEKYRDTWNLSVGGKYKLNNHITLLAGFGDIRLPDSDHYAASLGVDIQPRPGFVWSMGWTHLFIPTTDINNSSSNNGSTTPTPPTKGIGTSKGGVNVMGMQLSWDI